MEKTVNERLFEALMRAPRSVKRALMEENFGDEMRGAHHGHGPGGCHRRGEGEGPMHGQDMMHGPGPMGMHGHGPMHGHGHMGMHGHGHMGMHGHGFGRERALRVIAGFEGGVRQKTLTEELRINPSSVSELITKLQNDGYVKRTVDPEDKRATLITLTELGEARAAELQDEKSEMLGKAFANLTDDEKEQLIALLEKLTA